MTQPQNLWSKILSAVHHTPGKFKSISIIESFPENWKNIGAVGKEFTKVNMNLNLNLSQSDYRRWFCHT